MTMLKEPVKRQIKKARIERFLLGDRLELMRDLEDGSIDMIITSPPYNVNKQYKNHNDLLPYEKYLHFLMETWKESKRVLKTGGRIAINITSMTCDGEWKCLYNDVINQMKELGFIMRCDILWYKQSMSKRTAWGSWVSPSNPHVIQPYEFVFVFSKDTKLHKGRKEDIDISKEEFVKFSDAFWDIKAETTLSKKHPAPFPPELVYRLIKFYTYRNDVVLDMFGGTGTVASVAQKTGRQFIYMDNCEEYLQYAKERTLAQPALDSYAI